MHVSPSSLFFMPVHPSNVAHWAIKDSIAITFFMSTHLIKALKPTTGSNGRDPSVCLQQAHYQFLYDALESIFPVQNGEVKAVKSSAADSVQLLDETKAAEQPAEQTAASTTANSQEGEAKGAPAAAEEGRKDQEAEPEKISTEETGNGSTITVEV